MSMTPSHERVREHLLKLLDPEERLGIDEDARVLDSGLIDSMKVLEINASLLRTFQAEIPPWELLPENYSSVRALVGLCLRYCPGR
jgi:acyl carrier protein